jgi:hypothetical protein
MSELRILKLISGEEIVGEILSDTTEGVLIQDPCTLGIMQTQTGQPRLNMMPMLLFSEQKKVQLQKSHILYTVTVAQEIQNKYNEIYGSGIVLPKPSAIIR